jgi:hypothetical protein
MEQDGALWSSWSTDGALMEHYGALWSTDGALWSTDGVLGEH